MVDDLKLRQLQARQAAAKAAQQLGATDPGPAPTPDLGAKERVLSGQGLFPWTTEEAFTRSAAPILAPVETAATTIPTAETAGEIIGGTAGGMLPMGKGPAVLKALGRVAGSGLFGGLGAGAGGATQQEALNAGGRSALGEGIGEGVSGIFRRIFGTQKFLPGAQEAQAFVQSQGGHLTTSQLVEGGVGKWMQDFVEMAMIGSKPIRGKKEEAEALVQAGLDAFIAEFPKFPREEAGRLLQKSVEKAGWSRLKKGSVRADGSVVETKIVKKPYTGESIETMANRKAAHAMMNKSPDLAYQVLSNSKSETLIRKARGIMGAEWDIIQGQYLRDLATKAQKKTVEGGISGKKFFDQVSTVNDPVFKEFFPDPTQRRNLLLLARSLKIAEVSPKSPTIGGLAAQTAVFGGAGLGYAFGLADPGTAITFVATPYALGKLVATKGFTRLMTEGMKPGISVAKTTGLLTRMAALAGELELVPEQDYQLIEK